MIPNRLFLNCFLLLFNVNLLFLIKNAKFPVAAECYFSIVVIRKDAINKLARIADLIKDYRNRNNHRMWSQG
jgi:hypothetical protein